MEPNSDALVELLAGRTKPSLGSCVVGTTPAKEIVPQDSKPKSFSIFTNNRSLETKDNAIKSRLE